MHDEAAYKDRAPFDVSTLIEGEVQALVNDRTRPLPSPALRRLATNPNSLAPEQAPSDPATVDTPTAETGAGEAGPDYVNHPPHYTAHPSGVECITITEWMNFNLGNAVKYIWRSADKGATVEDLKKARWYLDREIDRLGRL